MTLSTGGLDTPSAGAIGIGDVELTALDERERTLFRRRHIGFVFQFFNLIPTLTVAENVALPLELIRRPASEIHTRVSKLLEAVGLLGREKTFPDRLSGGEQQRVAIARALVHWRIRGGKLVPETPEGNRQAP